MGAVLIGATLLVLGALSIPFLLQHLSSDRGGGEFSIGDCVVQDGLDARPAECNSPGAYEIVAQVPSQEECEDPTQPAIAVDGSPPQYYCLQLVADEPTDGE